MDKAVELKVNEITSQMQIWVEKFEEQLTARNIIDAQVEALKLKLEKLEYENKMLREQLNNK